jgi:hypothetical protein
MRVIPARLNAKPYSIRFLNKSDISPLHPGQDLPMEIICRNHWRISHRAKGGTAAFVNLSGSLKEQGEVNTQLETLANFFDKKMLPSLLLDVDSKRWNCSLCAPSQLTQRTSGRSKHPTLDPCKLL